jgi:hypothetical protein
MAITTKCVLVKAYWSIGLVEQAHASLRRAFEIIEKECLTTPREACLQMAVKTVNNTAGPDGLVPTLLVLGAFSRITELNTPTLLIV